jgi:Tfp pilus assembly protein PilN
LNPPLFAINFRRASYEQSLKQARRRVIRLGVWVAYLGVLGIVLGLFGLNCTIMSTRTASLERRVQRLQRTRAEAPEVRLAPSDVERIERLTGNPRFWRDKLTRLPAVLPPNARLTSVVINPERSNAPGEQRRLLLSGTLRTSGDRLQAVMRLTESFRADTAFARGYQSVRLASWRAPESDGGGAVEFTVECR